MNTLAPLFLWFDALTLRERLLILITVLAFILLPGYVLLIEPVLIEQQTLNLQEQRLERSNHEKRQDIQTLQAMPGKDPNNELAIRISELQQQLANQQTSVEADSQWLLSPDQVPALLSSLVKEQAGVRLVSLNKSQASPVLLKQADKSAPSKTLAGLYRHPLQLVLKGESSALLAYLNQLEQLPQQLFIDQVQWQYGKAENAEMMIELHSLGTSPAWLGGQS